MASNFGGVFTQAEPSSGSKSPARTVKFSLEKGKDSFHAHSDSEGEDDSNEPADDVFADSPGGGDESGAVKPWYASTQRSMIWTKLYRMMIDARCKLCLT